MKRTAGWLLVVALFPLPAFAHVLFVELLVIVAGLVCLGAAIGMAIKRAVFRKFTWSARDGGQQLVVAAVEVAILVGVMLLFVLFGAVVGAVSLPLQLGLGVTLNRQLLEEEPAGNRSWLRALALAFPVPVVAFLFAAVIN